MIRPHTCGLTAQAIEAVAKRALFLPHLQYAAVAAIPEARAEACRQRLDETLSDDDLKAIRTHLQQQRAQGRDDFRAMVEAKTWRFARVRLAHRPRRDKSSAFQVHLTPFFASCKMLRSDIFTSIRLYVLFAMY
jgi:hypothetical protein